MLTYRQKGLLEYFGQLRNTAICRSGPLLVPPLLQAGVVGPRAPAPRLSAKSGSAILEQLQLLQESGTGMNV